MQWIGSLSFVLNWRSESRKLLKARVTGVCLSYHTANIRKTTRQHVNVFIERYDILQSIIKRRKLLRLGHVCRHDTLPKTILQETVEDIKVVVTEEDCVERLHQWVNKPVTIAAAARCRLQKPMDNCECKGVCWSKAHPPPPDAGFGLANS